MEMYRKSQPNIRAELPQKGRMLSKMSPVLNLFDVLNPNVRSI